jgi:hypothetical protein
MDGSLVHDRFLVVLLFILLFYTTRACRSLRVAHERPPLIKESIMSELLNATKSNRWEQSKSGEPYWHEGATDPGADYRPSKPKKTDSAKPESGPEKSKPGEPYWLRALPIQVRTPL